MEGMKQKVNDPFDPKKANIQMEVLTFLIFVSHWFNPFPTQIMANYEQQCFN